MSLIISCGHCGEVINLLCIGISMIFSFVREDHIVIYITNLIYACPLGICQNVMQQFACLWSTLLKQWSCVTIICLVGSNNQSLIRIKYEFWFLMESLIHS